MKRQYRLRRPAHFQRVRSSGSHYDGAVLLLSIAPARQRTSRCGVVVARRLGGAVVRNRIKRRIREILRIHYSSLRPHTDIVVIARTTHRPRNMHRHTQRHNTTVVTATSQPHRTHITRPTTTHN